MIHPVRPERSRLGCASTVPPQQLLSTVKALLAYTFAQRGRAPPGSPDAPLRSGDGRTLTLASPLLYRHLGETRAVAGNHSVEFRANVALLSRNVVLQGTSPFSQLDRRGHRLNVAPTLPDDSAP